MSLLEDEMIDRMAKNFADDIDFEVLSGLMIDGGWTKVVLRPMTSETSDAIDKWIVENCKGNHLARGLVWVFESSKDATWFRMRWYE